MVKRLILLLNAVAFTLAYSQTDPGQPLDNVTAGTFKQCLEQIGNFTEIEKYLDNEEIYFYLGPDTDVEHAFYAVKECMNSYNVYIQLGVGKGQGKNYDERIYVDLLAELQDYQPKEMVEFDNGLVSRGNANMDFRFYSSTNCKGDYYATCYDNFDLNSCVTAHTKVSMSTGYDNNAGHEHNGYAIIHHDCRLTSAKGTDPREPQMVTWHRGSGKCLKKPMGSWWIRPDNNTPYPSITDKGMPNPQVCYSG